MTRDRLHSDPVGRVAKKVRVEGGIALLTHFLRQRFFLKILYLIGLFSVTCRYFFLVFPAITVFGKFSIFSYRKTVFVYERNMRAT